MPSEDDRFCCSNCFTDAAIKAYIAMAGESGICSFCNSESIPVLSVSTVAEFLDEGIARKYEDAAEQIPFESAEGGYQFDTLDVEEILLHHEQIFEDAPQCADPPLSEVVTTCSSYCTVPLVVQHPFSGPGDYVEEWEEFCEVAKHQSRFTVFMRHAERAEAWLTGEDFPYDREHETDALSELWSHFDDALPILVREVPAGQKFSRARLNPTGIAFTHEELTSPPRDKTRSNRMSPVGISYFYGSEDTDTCIAEIRPEIGARITIAEFETLRSLNILDVVDLPRSVSIFNGEQYSLDLEEFMKPFLMDFSHTIAQPVTSGYEQLEYVPTQVFCEFIKNNYWKHSVHGIRYKSAARQSGVSIVLFRGPEISLGPDPWLAFQSSSLTKITCINYQRSSANRYAEEDS